MDSVASKKEHNKQHDECQSENNAASSSKDITTEDITNNKAGSGDSTNNNKEEETSLTNFFNTVRGKVGKPLPSAATTKVAATENSVAEQTQQTSGVAEPGADLESVVTTIDDNHFNWEEHDEEFKSVQKAAGKSRTDNQQFDLPKKLGQKMLQTLESALSTEGKE